MSNFIIVSLIIQLFWGKHSLEREEGTKHNVKDLSTLMSAACFIYKNREQLNSILAVYIKSCLQKFIFILIVPDQILLYINFMNSTRESYLS
jgi:hypothetical protein